MVVLAHAPQLLRPAVAIARTSSVTALAPLAPVCATLGDAAVTAAWSGGGAVVAQLLLVAAFRRSNNRVLRELAGFAAHHTIELAFMILVTLVGAAGFLVPGAVGPTAAARMLAPNGTVRWLAAILLGKLMIWDFPCAFFIKKVRSAVILGHHAGMAATCALALHVPFCTGLFYLGVCELSTIPLQIWEGFEHAHKKAVDTAAPERQATRLAAVRDAGYTAFAPLFVAVRLLAFSWITFGCLLPDTLAVLPTAAAAGKRTALRMLCGFGVAFNALMLYWFGGAVVGMLNQPVTEEFSGVVVPTGDFAIPSEAEEAAVSQSVEP